MCLNNVFFMGFHSHCPGDSMTCMGAWEIWSVFGRLPENQGELKKMVFTGGKGIVNTPSYIVEIQNMLKDIRI